MIPHSTSSIDSEPPGPKTGARLTEQASARVVVLVMACFLAGLGVGVFWYADNAKRKALLDQEAAKEQAARLSPATLAVLNRLEGPLEIRFYALLDPVSVPASIRDFAARAGDLVARYGQAAEGKVTVARLDSLSDENSRAASADGIAAFNRDKGSACFLGVAVTLKGRRESLAHLSPDWEPALESDLTRAIARLVDASQASQSMPVAATVDAAAAETVKKLVPDYASVPQAEGERIIRLAALEEFQAAAKDFEAQIKQAQQDLTQAQDGGNEAQQQAAVRRLQQLQTDQTEKLKAIAARSQAQVQALQQLKKAAQ